MKFDRCKGWIINPKTKTIQLTEIRVDDGLDTLRKIIGCSLLERVPLQNTPPVTAWCDEEGRLDDSENNRYFTYHWLKAPNSNLTTSIENIPYEVRPSCPVHEIVFCNTIILFGEDIEKGEIQDVPLTLSDIGISIQFLEDDYVDEPHFEFISLDELH